MQTIQQPIKLMSEHEAAIAHLLRQRYSLKGWARSVDNQLDETPVWDKRHWDLMTEKACLKKEITRIVRRLKKLA